MINDSVDNIEAESASEEQREAENWLQDPRLTIDEDLRQWLMVLEQKRLQADRNG